MYLASEVTAKRHLPCEAISRYCPPAVSLDQGEGTLAKLFVVRAPIQFPKKGPSSNGDEPGPRGYLRRARGRRENLVKTTMFLARQNPRGANVNGAGVAPAGPRSAERALCETATRRGDLELGWERLCRARLVFCGNDLGPTRQKPVRKPQHQHAPRPDAGATTGSIPPAELSSTY